MTQNKIKFWFFSVLSRSTSRQFVFSYLFLFRVYFVVTNDNYFTSVIDLYNRLLLKIGPFKSSGEFSITNCLKFGFSLFCWVFLLVLFFHTCFYLVFFWFVWFFLIVIYNWEALSFFQRSTANIIKKAYNATEQSASA